MILEQDTSHALRFDGFRKRYPAFELDISLDVPRGFVTGLVGTNGAGKSTAIRAALGLTRPDAGRVEILDKAQIGVVLDSPAFGPTWTVEQTGRLLSRFYPRWDHARFRDLTEGWGVPAQRQVKELSRGMGMRLQLAAALSHDAELLILDEPTSGLDAVAREALLDDLADFMLDERHSILISSHISTDLTRLADYLVILDRGRVVASGQCDELLGAYLLASGSLVDLDETVQDRVLGLRRHAVGWDALVPTELAGALPQGVRFDAPTIDDLLIRLTKETNHA